MVLDFLFLTVTYAGGYLVTIIVTTFSAISFWLHGHSQRILPLLISVGGTAMTVLILKQIFNTARPLTAFYTESTPSFPSGHSAIAVALYGFLLFSAWKHDPHHLKNPFIIFLFFLIVGIGASRLYLGVHYFSDVLVGYVVGAVWLIISLIIFPAVSKLKT